MSHCGGALLPSGDPRIFGPPTWECLHILAQNCPAEANERTQRRWRRFLYTLSTLLPCRHCAQHFRRFLRCNDARLSEALSRREGLVAFLVDAHNEVTRHTRPGQPPYTAACAARQYGHMRPRNVPLASLWLSQSKPFSSLLLSARVPARFDATCGPAGAPPVARLLPAPLTAGVGARAERVRGEAPVP